MIRSYKKIKAIINNAKRFKDIIKEHGSFCRYVWSYSNYKTIIYDTHPEGNVPSCNTLSNKISQDLRKRGFQYIGPTTVYSYLQACGIINDHDKNCSRFHFINNHYPTIYLTPENEETI